MIGPPATTMSNWEIILLGGMTMVTSLAAAIGAYMNHQSIENVHISINSRMDQLLRSSVGEARAAGVVEGKLAKMENKS